MAAFALLSEQLTINSVDYTALSMVKSATLTLDAAQLDPTAMGDSWTEVLGGLKSGSLSVTFNDDYAASSIDQLLFPLFGTVTTFLVRPTTAVVGATNPNYTGSIFIAQHVLGGQIGDLASKSLTFPTSGAVLRAVA